LRPPAMVRPGAHNAGPPGPRCRRPSSRRRRWRPCAFGVRPQAHGMRCSPASPCSCRSRPAAQELRPAARRHLLAAASHRVHRGAGGEGGAGRSPIGDAPAAAVGAPSEATAENREALSPSAKVVADVVAYEASPMKVGMRPRAVSAVRLRLANPPQRPGPAAARAATSARAESAPMLRWTTTPRSVAAPQLQPMLRPAVAAPATRCRQPHSRSLLPVGGRGLPKRREGRRPSPSGTRRR